MRQNVSRVSFFVVESRSTPLQVYVKNVSKDFLENPTSFELHNRSLAQSCLDPSYKVTSEFHDQVFFFFPCQYFVKFTNAILNLYCDPFLIFFYIKTSGPRC